MNNFKKDGPRKGGNGFGGKPSFGGGSKFGGGGRGGDRGFDRGGRPGGEREMFKTVCDSCHKNCEVPFRPTGDKPVYCRDCFSKNDSDDSRSFNRSDSRGNDFRRDSRPAHAARPAHREEVRSSRDSGSDDVKRQLTKLEAKVDSILVLLNNRTSETLKSPKAKSPVALVVEPEVEIVVEETSEKTQKPKSIKSAKAKPAAKKKVAKKKTK